MRARVYLFVSLSTSTAQRAKVCSLISLPTPIAPRRKVFVIIAAKIMASRAKRWAVRRWKKMILKVLNSTGRQQVIQINLKFLMETLQNQTS